MNVCGIIAEFNPFHNGHAYLIERARESGFSHVIAVMSGNFVQRGEPAVIETAVRAEAALRAGADLVLQLPVPFALSGAENFARGAAEILTSAGVIDSLVFGSECGDIEMLSECARILSSTETGRLIAKELETGISYASARERALGSVSPQLPEIIREPNNILAVEYIKALNRSGSTLTAVTFKRNVPHDSEICLGGFRSASSIREMIKKGENISEYVPDVYGKYDDFNIVDSNRFEAAVLCNMRKMSAAEIGSLPDISEGIENRIYSASRNSSSLDGLYSAAKTKRYSHARIRRIVMCAFTGITAADAAADACYIRPLGINNRGAELLSLMKGQALLPVISRTSDIAELPPQAQRMFDLECRSTDLYTACLARPLLPGLEKDRKLIKI